MKVTLYYSLQISTYSDICLCSITLLYSFIYNLIIYEIKYIFILITDIFDLINSCESLANEDYI